MVWNKGVVLGLVYLVITVIFFGLTLQPPDGPLAWLGRFHNLVMIIPLFAAMHGYRIGIQDAQRATEP